jgi:hypothetical protein
VQGKISIPFEMLKNDGIRENKYFQIYVCCNDTGDPHWLLVKPWHLVYTRIATVLYNSTRGHTSLPAAMYNLDTHTN